MSVFQHHHLTSLDPRYDQDALKWWNSRNWLCMHSSVPSSCVCMCVVLVKSRSMLLYLLNVLNAISSLLNYTHLTTALMYVIIYIYPDFAYLKNSQTEHSSWHTQLFSDSTIMLPRCNTEIKMSVFILCTGIISAVTLLYNWANSADVSIFRRGSNCNLTQCFSVMEQIVG